METRATLADSLQRPEAYPHPVSSITVIETHISWVFLTGEFAYKVKKPLDLGFLDFSTLERRRLFCAEEVRLNRRLAPDVYLEALPITRQDDGPRISGSGEVLDYAVKMRQLPQSALLDHMLEQGELDTMDMEQLAGEVARFHQGAAPSDPDSEFGGPKAVLEPITENYRHLRRLDLDSATRERVAALARQDDAWAERLAPLLEQRRRDGFIRECHGDLHLGNIAAWRGRFQVFDGIEFNPKLHWIDIISDVAFLYSDLLFRGHPELAWSMLNRWLEVSGDFSGLALLDFYTRYRTLVRAKVAGIRAVQPALSTSEAAHLHQEFLGHIRDAERIDRPGQPMLIIMHGLSGSGKSVLSRGLAASLAAVRIRSDVERKRLFGLDAEQVSGSEPDAGLYTPEAHARTLRRLLEISGPLLEAGYRVIVDATFLGRDWRDPFRALAGEQGCPFIILSLHAEQKILERRVTERMAAGSDASEAGLEVLAGQLRNHQPLDENEIPDAIRIDGGSAIDMESLTALLLQVT